MPVTGFLCLKAEDPLRELCCNTPTSLGCCSATTVLPQIQSQCREHLGNNFPVFLLLGGIEDPPLTWLPI